MSPTAGRLLLLAVLAGAAAARSVSDDGGTTATAAAAVLRKCCPAGQQLSLDQSCVPISPRRGVDATFYATGDDGDGGARASGRDARPRRRAEDDWGWLPADVLITDSRSLEPRTLDDLRRAAREVERPPPRPGPGPAPPPPGQPPTPPLTEIGAPPCAPEDRELVFWHLVELFSNGTLHVAQPRPDLFRPSGEQGPGVDVDGGDEGERSYLFPAGTFCMDRLSLRPVETVTLDADPAQEQEMEDAVAEDALLHNETTRAAAPGEPGAEGEDADDEKYLIHAILLCPCGPEGRNCVRKCCHPGSVMLVDAKGDTECRVRSEVMQPAPPADRQHSDEVAAAADHNKARAAEAAREWGPNRHRHPDDAASALNEDFLLHALPHCSNAKARRFLLNSVSTFNAPSKAAQFWIRDDGTAVVDSFGMDNWLPGGSFCGEVMLDSVTGAQAANLLVCSDSSSLAASPRTRILYGVLATVGAAFLAATLLVHACLPELRRSLHSSNLMAHTGSLLLAYIALAVNALSKSSLPDDACLLLAFVLQFSFLAAFFWLNVMCIDISWAFSGIRTLQGSAAERDRKKFLWYSLYAWGASASITLLTAAINFLTEPGSHVLHPRIAHFTCWFTERNGALIYFYSPMAFLLLINLVLFVYTAARILAVRKDTEILRRVHRADNSSTGSDTQRLLLYVKLFCLMGLTWIMEIISWVSGGRDYYWYATDAVNLLRAVFIFVIFCCKRKVLRLAVDRLTAASDSGETCRSGTVRSGAGARGFGRGPGTTTSSLNSHPDPRRLQHTASQDSNLTVVTSPSPSPNGVVLALR